MAAQPSVQQPDPRSLAAPLVPLEPQPEPDRLTGDRSERIFVKLYAAARTSGLLAAISDRDWKTLCAIATYMNHDGFCFPSQEELARALGCTRPTANERIQSLAKFRFQGHPIFCIVPSRRTRKGTWSRNGYRVLPMSRLRMYDRPGENSAVSANPDAVSPAPVSACTVSATPDTNKNQHKPEDEDLSKFERSHDEQISADGDSRLAARSAPEGRETASAALGSAHGTPMPLPTVSRPTGPENAESAPGPERSVSPAFLAARAAIRSTLAARRRREGDEPRPARRREPSASSPPSPPIPPAAAPPPVPSGPAADVPPAGHARRCGRPRIGTSQERELVLAYLDDFNRELLHDDAPMASLVTQTINIFRAANLPQDSWPDYLYQARTAVKEHAGAITKASRRPGAVKNRGPYYFAVLRDLVASAQPAPRFGG